ncbi:hypothetical protein LX15_003135 [Streptoalloteichus tenebrarius]|uniref:Uncharacterized protein n=1 Tax=Streptoalloteichus tenebrarius (strain ATCC 17920 / DSM 40477 / JCM 4838 / CBS 697.72 / NBRC 16177 / NCIMB 11028 / NRRL B-12390 / A12253. 1 / ISP 5477) TaxID=1933 RepID=A0ABT1HV91_STRSD|nr:hypothetical protein [Streptoalloteichus tenebrarius]BFF02377.1 hypothetical protein GCM10020241_40520 [Streptoalloteichus tenebrarius]
MVPRRCQRSSCPGVVRVHQVVKGYRFCSALCKEVHIRDTTLRGRYWQQLLFGARDRERKALVEEMADLDKVMAALDRYMSGYVDRRAWLREDRARAQAGQDSAAR